MTVRQAMELADCSDTLIKRWLKRGDIKGRKVGGEWVIEGASVRAFLNKPRGKGRPRKEQADV